MDRLNKRMQIHINGKGRDQLCFIEEYQETVDSQLYRLPNDFYHEVHGYIRELEDTYKELKSDEKAIRALQELNSTRRVLKEIVELRMGAISTAARGVAFTDTSDKDFIKNLQQKKSLPFPIPISCFTATAKPQVIEDIKQYFQDKLQIDLKLFKTNITRKNLHYNVINCADGNEKYNRLRDLIDSKPCPTIVYVSRTRKAKLVAEKLTQDGYAAKPFHGKMDSILTRK